VLLSVRVEKVLLACSLSASWSSLASAAPKAHEEAHQPQRGVEMHPRDWGGRGAEEVLVRHSATARPLLDHSPADGLKLRLERELEWTRMNLETPRPLALWNGPPMLSALDVREEMLLATPRAFGSVVSAFGSLATSGKAVAEIRRGGRLQQRHFITTYFRQGGLRLCWRIEF